MSKLQKILVVEDEPGIADTVDYALRTEGFEVSRATTGESALSQLESVPHVLAVIDVGLPDMNGFDLCRRLRTFTKMPVIFLTARAEPIDRIVGLEIGADDYITKPFHPRELAARVRAVLRRISEHPQATVPEQLSAGGARPGVPFAVDSERRQISYFGAVLTLSRYEYKLLEILISRPGRVFTREQLMTHAWDEPEASLERTVDTHIKTIRAQLREVRPDVDPIVTHRGIGYSLREDW